jgi:hypothetical protein
MSFSTNQNKKTKLQADSLANVQCPVTNFLHIKTWLTYMYKAQKEMANLHVQSAEITSENHNIVLR